LGITVKRSDALVVTQPTVSKGTHNMPPSG